ncbi:MAG: hypothetical protein OQK12_05910 [Motiliproteus sp.]|nr:hypothetical protein [Motiliproteus sp.]MCW9050969.1 hypothetical protein [Motiliproteus sp.]
MAQHLTKDDAKRIVDLLNKWQYKLTWDELVAACVEKLGIPVTRQKLDRNKDIKDTFNLTKERLKVKGEHYARPNSLNVAHQRIEALASERDALRGANDFLIEKFARWQFNALNRGLTEEELEWPLPQEDLGNVRNIKGAK